MMSGPGRASDGPGETAARVMQEASPLEQAVLDYLDACSREFDELEQLWFAEGDALESVERELDDWAA